MALNYGGSPYFNTQSAPMFPQPNGNVYLIQNSLEVANIPTSGGLATVICMPENLMYIKTIQNGQPTLLAYTIAPYEARETRELIVANTIQDLRDRLADKDRDLVEANNLISQYSQTSTIIGALQNKSPVPAYVVGYATNGMVPGGYDYTYFGSSAGGCQTCRGQYNRRKQ